MAKTALNKSAEFEQYYQALGNKYETKIFDSMKDVFMFALTLGFKNNQKLPLGKTGGEPISLRIFDEDDKNIFSVIALAHTNDISILLDDDECIEKRYKIMEEFANGGIKIMAEAFCKPIVDENEFKKFIEAFNTEEGQQHAKSLEEILAGAIDSV